MILWENTKLKIRAPPGERQPAEKNACHSGRSASGVEESTQVAEITDVK